MPALSLEWPSRRAHLARRRCRQHAGPQPHGAPRGAGQWQGAAGHWVDFATGEHGDLLDLIARTCRLDAFRDVLDEARRFLSLPQSDAQSSEAKKPLVPRGSPEAARRLFASAKPIRGTIAEIYLRNREITDVCDLSALRFHPRCYYRAHDDAPREIWPALLTAVTDLNGIVTGVQRTWLERDGSDKAPLATPRRAMGHLLGHGARLGTAANVMAAGEGLETMLSLRVVLPTIPITAGLSATHLAALVLPSDLRRSISPVTMAGRTRAAQALSARATANAIETLVLTPHTDDFNSDLCTLGTEVMAASLRSGLHPTTSGAFCA